MSSPAKSRTRSPPGRCAGNLGSHFHDSCYVAQDGTVQSMNGGTRQMLDAYGAVAAAAGMPNGLTQQRRIEEEERLLLYQKMAGIVSIEDLQALKDKMIRSRTKEEQRSFPQEVLNLFAVLEIRILAQKTDLSHIDTTLVSDEYGHKIKRVIIKFLFPLKAENLAKLLQRNIEWKFTDDAIKIDHTKLGEKWIEELKKTVKIFQNPSQQKK